MLDLFVGAIFVGFFALVSFACLVMIRFFEYCNRVARLEGRSSERHSPWGHVDKGLNAFERELMRGLSSGKYIDYQDSDVVELGRRLAKNFFAIKVTTFLLIGLVIAWDLIRRGVFA